MGIDRWMVGAAALALTTTAAPPVAEACGGFFCSRSSPMSQAGEKIVFSVEDDGTTTTHVQILYSGRSESFAWILPVPSVPELSVGTDLLFDGLDPATAPQFPLARTTEGTCRRVPTCPAPDSGSRAALDAGGGFADAAASDASPSSPPVTVHLREAVGPYDAAVISSDDATAVQTWLADNGYDVPDAANEHVAHYVEKNDYFVALKLLSDRTSGEIQPIVLRYQERQPCIPIRLTSIATVPDMPITAWVLGPGRATPYNYLSVEPDLNDRALWLGGANYAAKVTAAVEAAGGRAFVTEYAGAVPSISIAVPDVEDLRTVTDPAEVVRQLSLRGLSADAQLLGILLRHIPPPDGTDAPSFYNCLVDRGCSAHDGYLATLAFDPSALVDDLNTAIVTPREEALAMLARHPKLTRLFTTMDAEDMTEDPVFTLEESMPDVSNVHRATLVTECGPDYFEWSAPQRIELPSGVAQRVRAGRAYTGTDAEYCEERGPAGWGGSGGTAEPDGRRAGGGGSCSASSLPSGVGGGVALASALLLVVLRRRRRA